MDQSKKTKLKKFNMDDSKPRTTPCELAGYAERSTTLGSKNLEFPGKYDMSNLEVIWNFICIKSFTGRASSNSYSNPEQ